MQPQLRSIIAAFCLLLLISSPARAVVVKNCQLCTVSGFNNVCPKPTGLVEGQAMIVVVMHSNNAYGSLPSGWSSAGGGANFAICGQSISNGPNFIYLFYKKADSTDVAASNFTFVWGSNFAQGGGICSYDNVSYDNTVSPPTPLDRHGSGNVQCHSDLAGSTTVTFPSFTTTVNNDLLVGAADATEQLGSTTITGPVAYTQRLTFSPGGGLSFWMGDDPTTTSGTYGPSNGSQTFANQYNALSFAILTGPPAGGGVQWPFP